MAKNILKFTVTGIVAGIAFGWLLSLVSGNLFVVLFVGTLGLLVGGFSESFIGMIPSWRQIPITLINIRKGDEKAHACVMAWLRQLRKSNRGLHFVC